MLKVSHLRIVIPTIFLWGFSLLNLSSLKAQVSKKDSIYTNIQHYKLKTNYQKDTVYINLLYTYGKSYGFQNLDSLLILAEKTIDLSKRIDYTKGIARGHIILGNYYSDTGDTNKAIESFKKALNSAEQINDVQIIIMSKSSLATAYTNKGDYAKALKEYLTGIEIAKENNLEDSLSILYVNITVVYSMQNDYEQCIYFLTKAMKLNKKIDNKRLTAITLTNLASSYIDSDDFENATKKVDEAIVLLEKLQLQDWLTFAYELKATIYLEQEKFEEALNWFKKSEKLHESIKQERYKIPMFNGISKAYFNLKEYEKTEYYALKGLEIGDKLDILDQRDEILETLYELKKATNNPIDALGYLEKFKAISDTINKKNNEKELRFLKSNLEFDQEKERYILENEKVVAKQRLYFYGALLIILAFSIIIYILRRNNKIQSLLYRKLTVKTKQLQKKEKHLLNSNNTKTKLFSVIAHDLKGPINSFKSMFDMLSAKQMSSNEFIGFVPTMGESIDSIAFTLNNLLSWGQTQMNGIVTKPENTCITTLVNQNNALLSKMAAKKSISLENNISEKVLAWCDKNQISIVIRNLTSNALKFTPENGSISFGANEKGKYWEVYVKDTGIGISDSALDKIFNTEENFTTYGTNNEKGTGLGLVLCKEMIEKNNGEIYVKSSSDKGTCFYFTVPKAAVKKLKS